MHLKLSDDPPADWDLIFDEERKFPRHSMWRHAKVSGAYIVVDCPPEEIAKYHLADLKADVANTNQKYRKLLVARESNAAQKLKVEADEKQSLESLRGKLKFD